MNNTKKTLPKTDSLPGVVLSELKRCGKPNCRCHSRRPEDLHGPYFYRFFRENGRLRKAYVANADVTSVRAACAQHRRARQAQRRVTQQFQQEAHTVDEMLRQIEALWKS